MKKMIIMGVVFLVLLVGAVFGTLFFTGALNKAPAADPAAAAVPAAPPAPVLAEPQYYVFDPSFVVNIDDGFGTRYLQLEMSLMYRDITTGERITKALPPIRNDIVMILSSKNREELRLAEGRVALQKQLLDAINAVLIATTGSAGVEQVYFTKFVIQ